MKIRERKPVVPKKNKRIKRIRGGSGFGDALYVQPVAKYYCQKEALEVCTDWPTVFSCLRVNIAPFSRQNIDYLAHYSKRKEENTTQFEDCCLQAGVNPKRVDYSLDWTPKKDHGLPKEYVLVGLPRTPMDRTDGFGRELLPEKCGFEAALAHYDLPVVLIGKGAPAYDLKVDYDFTQKTTVSDVLDLACNATALIGQCSYIIPLAESFDKPLIAVWSAKGLLSDEKYVARITPKKILHKPTSRYLMDDELAVRTARS